MEKSFALRIKDELFGQIPRARHCRIAEIAAISLMAGKINTDKNEPYFCLENPSDKLLKKYFTLIDKTSTIGYYENRLDGDFFEQFLFMIKADRAKVIKDRAINELDKRLISQDCCKQVFLRGAFLASGYVNDPENSYNFEIVCRNNTVGKAVADVMASFGVVPKVIDRKAKCVVYIKEASQIVEILGVMGASVGLMEMENIRILKEMRGNVNRQVNCEAANISKTISAAVRQMEDIRYIHEHGGLDLLPPSLKEIAQVRMEHPQVSLQELGEIVEPPISKSGVNNRLRRISKFAQDLREEGESAFHKNGR